MPEQMSLIKSRRVVTDGQQAHVDIEGMLNWIPAVPNIGTEPLSKVEAIKSAASPTLALMHLHQTEINTWEGEHGPFNTIGRQYCRYFFRINNNDHESAILLQTKIIKPHYLKSDARGLLKYILDSELEQLDLGYLKELIK